MIVINDAHRLCPWADVLYSSDQRWWSHHKGVPGFAGLKFGIYPLKPAPEWGIAVLGNAGGDGMASEPDRLKHGRNSGYAAVNLAKHFGATRVLLLGYDMRRTQGRTHWFGEHPEQIRADSPYPSFLSMFATLVEPIRRAGVEVINCTPGSALTVFPRRALRDVLPGAVAA